MNPIDPSLPIRLALPLADKNEITVDTWYVYATQSKAWIGQAFPNGQNGPLLPGDNNFVPFYRLTSLRSLFQLPSLRLIHDQWALPLTQEKLEKERGTYLCAVVTTPSGPELWWNCWGCMETDGKMVLTRLIPGSKEFEQTHDLGSVMLIMRMPVLSNENSEKASGSSTPSSTASVTLDVGSSDTLLYMSNIKAIKQDSVAIHIKSPDIDRTKCIADIQIKNDLGGSVYDITLKLVPKQAAVVSQEQLRLPSQRGSYRPVTSTRRNGPFLRKRSVLAAITGSQKALTQSARSVTARVMWRTLHAWSAWRLPTLPTRSMSKRL